MAGNVGAEVNSSLIGCGHPVVADLLKQAGVNILPTYFEFSNVFTTRLT